MQHEYTDEQIFESNKIAARTTGRDWISRFNLRDVRAILDALPDQPGNDALREQAGLYKELIGHPFFKDWSISGTSVRSFMMNKLDSAMTPQDDWEACAFEDIQKGDRFKVEHANWSYEGQVKWIDAEVICYDPRFGTAITPQNIDDMRGITLYRIPAPVTPPDPALHQFIRVDGKDYKAIPESGRYQLLEAGLATVHVINREDITEWTELELVPKEVADND